MPPRIERFAFDALDVAQHKHAIAASM